MGGGSSRRKQPNVPFPQYSPPMVAVPPVQPPSPNMSAGGGGPASLNRRQIRQYEDANRTIQNLQNQFQRGSGFGGPSYGGPPVMNAPMPYGSNPNMGQPPSYPPPSPLLQRLSAQSPYSFPQQQHQSPFGATGYRDSDYAAFANISGLNPADIALLHREYLNLTRGGINKIDRVVFRQLLREALVEANNENIDRAIENIFISIDRNRDGFIDFPEFVGAFRDLLRTGPDDPQQFLSQYGLSDLIHEQTRANVVNSNYICQPMASAPQQQQQQQQQPQIISLPPSSMQQAPLIYNGSQPLVISLDANQSPYIVNTQGQCMTAQPGSLQCVQLPMM